MVVLWMRIERLFAGVIIIMVKQMLRLVNFSQVIAGTHSTCALDIMVLLLVGVYSDWDILSPPDTAFNNLALGQSHGVG